MAVNTLQSSCSGWIPAGHYLYIGFIVKLLFDRRRHCMERMSRGLLAIVSTPLGQIFFLGSWAFILPWSRRACPGPAINLPLQMWCLKGEGQREVISKPQSSWRKRPPGWPSEPQRPREAGELTSGPDSKPWPWASPLSPQEFCFSIHNTRMHSQGPSNSAFSCWLFWGEVQHGYDCLWCIREISRQRN